MSKNIVLEKKALDLERLIKTVKRKLLEFEILLSKEDFKKGRFKVYKKAKDFIENL